LVARKLEIVFMNKDGKFYPLDEVSSVELAEGLEKISKETAKRLSLQKDQR
jgi:Cu/Ag efflux pump CusA